MADAMIKAVVQAEDGEATMNTYSISDQAIQIHGIGSGNFAAGSIAASRTSSDQAEWIINWTTADTGTTKQYPVFVLEATTNRERLPL